MQNSFKDRRDRRRGRPDGHLPARRRPTAGGPKSGNCHFEDAAADRTEGESHASDGERRFHPRLGAGVPRIHPAHFPHRHGCGHRFRRAGDEPSPAWRTTPCWLGWRHGPSIIWSCGSDMGWQDYTVWAIGAAVAVLLAQRLRCFFPRAQARRMRVVRQCTNARSKRCGGATINGDKPLRPSDRGRMRRHGVFAVRQLQIIMRWTISARRICARHPPGRGGRNRRPCPLSTNRVLQVQHTAGNAIFAGKTSGKNPCRTLIHTFFWLIGNALSILTGGYVSGNIIGMILLLRRSACRWVKAETTVRPAAKFLLGAMALLRPRRGG